MEHDGETALGLGIAAGHGGVGSNEELQGGKVCLQFLLVLGGLLTEEMKTEESPGASQFVAERQLLTGKDEIIAEAHR